MKLISILAITSAFLFTNCENGIENTEVNEIEYGTSFGMCAGYCTRTITLSEGEITKTLIPQLSQALTVRVCSDSFDGFASIVSKVDVSAFMSLDETIGCPDCADGGAEWVEITSAQGARKVTFEFGNEPNEIQALVADLREKFEELGECD